MPFSPRFVWLSLVALLYLVAAGRAYTYDIVIPPAPQSELDVRDHYKLALLHRALQLTGKKYGAYEIKLTAPKMNRSRALEELRSGKLLNLYFAVESPQPEDAGIRIPIPIRRGILNYRLLLVHKDNLSKFEHIEDVAQLKDMRLGLRSDWSTSQFLIPHQFNMVGAQDYEGLFTMLGQKRFDYTLRGPQEIYTELEKRPDLTEKLAIVPNLVLYMPLSTYIYVSPQYPRLAERVELGLNRMVENGELATLFNYFFAEYIKQAELCERKILFITPEHEKAFNDMQSPIYKPCEEL